MYNKFYLLLTIAVLSIGNVLAEKESNFNNIRIVPEDLYINILQEGCEQISDFYKKYPGVKRPPYIYGLFTGEVDVLEGPADPSDPKFQKPDYSSAVWARCKNDEKEPDSYTLLLNFNNEKKGMATCPVQINNIDMVGGLYVVSGLSEPLDWYVEVDTNKKIEAGGEFLGNGILSIYDGTGYLFYCYSGKWVTRSLH